MRIFRYIKCWIQTMMLAPKQAGYKKQIRETELVLIAKYPQPQDGPYLDFSDYATVLSDRVRWFRDWVDSGGIKGKGPKTVLIGNSIGDMARADLFSIDTRLNFAKGGFWIHHMAKMYLDMRTCWDRWGFVPPSFFIETPGGNNLLLRQDATITLIHFIDFLNQIRADYPQARIIIGDLPSSIVAYLIQSKPIITQRVYEWVNQDCNSCLLLFVENYVSAFKILPKTEESIEGVHMTPLGHITMDNEIITALTTNVNFIA